MKKLLFFASDFSIGLSELLTDQLEAIHRSGINYYAVAGDGEQVAGLWDRVSEFNIEHVAGLDKHEKFSELVSRIQTIISREGIDVVHVQNNWQLAIMSVVKMRMMFRHKLEIVYTLHGFRHNHPLKSVIARGMIGSGLLMFSTKVICMTEYLKGKFRLLSYKIKLIPLGISEECYGREFVRPKFGGLHMVFPAQFRVGKNQDMIIKAFAEHVKRSGDNESRLVLPGSGDMLDDCKRLADSLGIASQVVFPGRLERSAVVQAYLDSNIAIVSSNSETYGQSIVEPYVMGRCVLSRPVGIATEIITDGESGYLFDNEKDLSEIMTELYNNPDILEKIGCRNFEHRDEFRWENITDKYINEILK